MITYTVNPVYNDHPWDPKIEVFVDGWSSFSSKSDLKVVAGGRYSEVVVCSGITVCLKNQFTIPS